MPWGSSSNARCSALLDRFFSPQLGWEWESLFWCDSARFLGLPLCMMLCDSEAIRLWPWLFEPPSAGVALNGVRHRGSHCLMAGFFSIIGAEAGVGRVVADVASELPELRRSLLSDVELRGLKYWWTPVLSGGVLSALRCVCEALRLTSRTIVCVSGSGITRGASRFGEGRRGG